MTEAKDLQRELIAFRIGSQEFCVDIMSVREIRGWTPATPLPRSPGYMKGVINLRGTVLPIMPTVPFLLVAAIVTGLPWSNGGLRSTWQNCGLSAGM